MIKIYQMEVSPYCDKIRRVLNYKKQAYEVEELSAFAIKKVASIGKVPALRHDETLIQDSTQIFYYLEEKFPEPALIPENLKQRALCHFFEDWADESLYNYDIAIHFSLRENQSRINAIAEHEKGWKKKFMQKMGPTFARKQINAQGVGLKPREMLLEDIERHLTSISDYLGNDSEWLVGDNITLADIAVFVQVYAINFAPQGAEIIERLPNLVSWMKRVDQTTSG